MFLFAEWEGCLLISLYYFGIPTSNVTRRSQNVHSTAQEMPIITAKYGYKLVGDNIDKGVKARYMR